jgi:uncharacterized protein (TIGR02466 family)
MSMDERCRGPALPEQGLVMIQNVIQIGDGAFAAFLTPLLILEIGNAGELNRGLLEAIHARRRQGPERSISNRGGWQSSSDLWNWEAPAIAGYRSIIASTVQKLAELGSVKTLGGAELQFSVEAWANINGKGDYNIAHHHPGSQWAMVYYVASPPADPNDRHGGRLELRDPRPRSYVGQNSFFFGRDLLVDPVPGKLVVFPAFLDHFVNPSATDGERVSIAANVSITNQAFE